ncbi:MAG: hypothetical protein M1833_003408 [Piccolia ochrophora]|nr:MAG: hypothetical protein M1833_003408 [Piccolia ochrophora]
MPDAVHLPIVDGGTITQLTPERTTDTPSSSFASPSTTRFTPDSDSDDASDVGLNPSHNEFGDDFELKEIGGQLRRVPRSDGIERDSDDGSEGSYEEKYFRQGRERSYSEPTAQSYMLYTPDEESAVVRRFDRRVVLLMGFLYMLSFLDRSNIGNVSHFLLIRVLDPLHDLIGARIAGLQRDLRLSSTQYEWLLTAFYITYILFEWMTLLYRLFPPHIYIALCVLSWGVIASCQAVATSFKTLLVLRALLGISEAAFGPGVPFYLSFFYKREELALRTGLFISAAPLATSFASSLAWVITKLGQRSPIAPWRLLFLVEGFPSVVVAVFVWQFVPDSPGRATFLSRRQRKVAKLRLRKNDGGSRGTGEESKGLKWSLIIQTLQDPKCYLTACMFFSCNVAFSSLPVFLPTIINEMGYTPIASQALTTPPYLVSFATVLITAYVSDRTQSRSTFLIFHALLSAAGYTYIALTSILHLPPLVRYLGVYPATAGFFSAITLIIAWTLNNQTSATGRGTGVAMLNVLGQCGPLLGTRLYPDSDAPLYVRGMSVCAVFMVGVAGLAVGLRWWLRRENVRAGEKAGRSGQWHYML